MSELSRRIAALTPEQRQALLAKLGTAPTADSRAAQGIARRVGTGACQASFAQERMWFLHKLDPKSSAYNGSTALHLAGPLDVVALERSLTEIVGRHEILRSTFEDREGQLVQVPGAAGAFSVPIIDLAETREEARSDAVRQQLREDASRPFDLSRGPLLRATLIRKARQEHILLLTAHHIVSDGWSVEPLVKELSALYAAFVDGQPASLPDLPIQYGDFAVWERARLQGETLERQLAYWRKQLAGLTPLSLLTDRQRPAAPTYRGAPLRVKLSGELTDAVRKASRAMNATIFMTLLAAFKVLLFHYTGQSDLAVGLPIANRKEHELETLVGFFANLVVLRTEVTADLRLRDIVERVRDVTLGAIEHQQVPFEKLVEELCPSRDVSHNPLVQVTFVVQNATFEGLKLKGLTVSQVDLEEETTRFDLEMHAWDRSDGIELVTAYRPDLFEAGTVARLVAHYVRVLTQVVGAPGGRVGAVELLGAGERAAVVAGGTGAAGAYPREATLGALVGAQVAARPDAVAVEDGATRWTYGEVGRRAAQLAGVLRAAGVGPNVAVGVWLERGAPLVTTLVGIAVAGGAYVPLEVTQPAGRAAGLWAAAGTAVVVTTAAGAATVPAGPWRVVTLEAVAGAPAAAVAPQGTATDLAYVLYTSGSTGRPKGVAVPQRAVVRLVCGTDYVRLGPETVVGQAATAAFDAATFEIWGALLHGGRVVVVPTAVAVAPGALGAYLQRTGVTTLFLTTALVHQIGREAPGALAGLDTVLFGGEAVEPRWVAAIQAAGGPRRLVHVYGPTETTTFATWYAVGAVEGDAGTIPIGGPIAQTQVYVLDGGGGVVPVGVPGELYIGGDGLAQGYVGAARQTAARFVPDGVSGAAGARLYRTGDVGRWTAPGVLTFLGRRDGQVKLRGYRIELGEVEAALTGLPAVGAAAVVVQGAGDARRLVGYVVAAAGATLEAGALRTALKTQLPGYMVPATLVVVPGLPLNANGKVDRGALPAVAAGAAAAAAGEGGGGAPRSTVEAQIAAVWAQALGVATVGVGDNFFDVGGHSLLLVRVQAGLEAALGRRVPLVTLFQYPTVEGLAAHLTGAAAAAPPAGRAAGAAGPAGIAVIGVAGRFPGAPDVATFWGNLRAGVESIRQFSAAELAAAGVPAALAGDPRYVPARGVLAEVAGFDAGLFGYTPREAALLDPQQRLLLECAWTALEQAGYAAGTRQAVRIGAFVGCSESAYSRTPIGHEAIAAPEAFEWLLASSKDFLATRVSYKLRLTGPSVTVQTACSTSLVAVHLACQALAAGECEIALAGGVSVTVPEGGYLYHPDGIASPDGHCRAFDAGAAGTVAGNGVGMVVLKPLGAALAAGDTIQAVIRGTAINNDGADKVGFTAPSVSGQAAVVAAAQAAAGVGAASIGYIEAHGTGTALGDPIEVAALREVFGAGAGPGTCGLGSVKTNVGHLDAAAGVTGLIKTVLALQQGEIPPSLHFAQANPQLDLGPFYVPTTVTPWRAAAGTPRRAGVSAFGMGGTNAHVIVEEAPARAAAPGDAAAGDGVPGDAATAGPAAGRAWQVVPVSGQSAAAVAAAAEQLATYLETHPAAALADVAYTQQVGRTALGQRRVAVGPDAATVAAQLRTGGTETAGAAGRPVVWMFPGQGTQTVGMGRALYAQAPGFRAELEACAAVVAAVLGGDLIGVLYPAPGGEAAAAARLAEPAWTQVGLVAVELALAAQWRAWGVTPQAVIGHSVGELAAACVAGVLTREAALRLAATRGTLMGAAPAGGLLAVGAGAEAVTPHLGADLWLAAVNSPTQCVVAGTGAALRTGAARLAAAGYATQPLAAAGAFHSGLLAGVVAPLTAAAAALPLAPPHLPWISTVTGTALTAAEATDPAYWGRQVTAPVQWAAAVTTARATLGAAPLWLEVGPGPTLTRLTRAGAAPEERALASLTGPDAAQSVATALAQLWTAGVPLDWAATHAGAPRRRLPLPTYPFQHRRYWLDPAPDVHDAAERALVKNPDIARWFYTPAWHRSPIEPAVENAHAPAMPVVFVDSYGIGDRVLANLEAAGHAAVKVERGEQFTRHHARAYTLDPGNREHYAALLADLAASGESPTQLMHCWSVRPPHGRAPASDDGHAGLLSVLYLTQALNDSAGATSAAAASRAAATLLIVTSHAQDVTGEEQLEPSHAAVLGLSRVIAQEHPGLGCRTVDVCVDSDEDLRRATAEQLTMEFLSSTTHVAVAYRGTHRWVERFTTRRLAPGGERPRLLRQNGVYLITGGLGKVGLELARFLAGSTQATLILVGRSTPPEADLRGALQPLQALGAEVFTVAADVANLSQMTAVVEGIDRRHGRLDGVIHAAGLTSGPTFAPIAALDRHAFEEQFRSKVEGTLVLAQVLAGRALDFCVLVSSLSTTLGGHGFGAYASANAFLDGFASAQSRVAGVPWMSVAWEGWAFGSAAAAAGSTARLALTPLEGADAFARIMNAAPVPQTVVSTADLEARVAQWVTPQATWDGLRHDDRRSQPTHARRTHTPYVAPRSDTERRVSAMWEELLGIEQIGVDDDFFELGGHSLLGTQLMSRVRDAFAIDLTLTALFAERTVAGLSARIDRRCAERLARREGAASQVTRIKTTTARGLAE